MSEGMSPLMRLIRMLVFAPIKAAEERRAKIISTRNLIDEEDKKTAQLAVWIGQNNVGEIIKSVLGSLDNEK